MDKHSLELFVETVRTLSFAETARRLGLDPSHVSRSVLSLEREVGATLLARTTRRMTLTEAGRGFHTHARATLSSWEAAVDAARDAETEVRGPVRISVSVAFGETLLVPLLPQLRRALPSVVPELVFDDTRFDLIDAGLDLAIRLGGPPEPDLRAERLFDVRYTVYCAPDFALRDALTGDPEKLADVPAVVQDLPGFRDRWQLSGRDVAVPITPAVKVSSALAARGAAVAGVGPALLADWLAAPVVEARQLACLYPDLSFDVAASAPAAWLVRPASVPETAKVAAVAHFLRENLRGSGTFTGD